MTKTTEAKTYKLSDFFTKSNAENSTKMDLLFDGENTGCHLLVKGIESKSVQRARITAQVAYADLAEAVELITDKVDKAISQRDEKELIDIELAKELITGWSFPDFSVEALSNILDENKGLAIAVISHALEPSNYLAKK